MANNEMILQLKCDDLIAELREAEERIKAFALTEERVRQIIREEIDRRIQNGNTLRLLQNGRDPEAWRKYHGERPK
jgi:hypothetical protein